MQALTRFEHGIHAIDAGYEGPIHTSIHLIVEKGRVAVIDTGHSAAIPALTTQMESLGLKPEAVDYVILTHIHLDHAGAAGALMQRFATAQLVVHPRGARHMTAPEKLWAAVQEVYGAEQAQRTYGGAPLAVPADRVIEAQDGQRLDFNGRELLLFDAPGHAKHHIAIRDGRSGHIFTGDTFGLSYRQLDANGRQFIFPTTSPSQFDPVALHNTVSRIADFHPEAVYVTHYSQVREVQRLAQELHALIDAHVEIALRERDSGAQRHQRIKDGLGKLIVDTAAQQGWALQGDDALRWFAVDQELNAQGLGIWLDSGG
ncbi:MAG: MBL fold metallo-hydrolase [Rhodocyclaceae bacterium]|nr:MBL fold metallo-hydrolase [Rhodocyclaceae bacterium]